MIGCIRKDLYYLCGNWRITALSIAIGAVYVTMNNLAAILIILLPVFIAMSILGCVQSDAQKNWYAFNCIIPLSLRKIVSSRYLAYLLFMLIGLVLAGLYGITIQLTLGSIALGNYLTLIKALMMGVALTLGFGCCFLPATYYFHGEKMEICMMISAFVAFGIIVIAHNILALIGISIRDYQDMTTYILFFTSAVLFLISWLISVQIYKKRRII